MGKEGKGGEQKAAEWTYLKWCECCMAQTKQNKKEERCTDRGKQSSKALKGSSRGLDERLNIGEDFQHD